MASVCNNIIFEDNMAGEKRKPHLGRCFLPQVGIRKKLQQSKRALTRQGLLSALATEKRGYPRVLPWERFASFGAGQRKCRAA